MEKHIKHWYRTLELSAHCLCEQGYNADNIIQIAEYLEQSTGVKANPVVPEIKKTIEFHRWWNRKEKQEAREMEKLRNGR